ncbi:galactose-1-phosphate uridylyltransferase [Gordonibacter sp. 28C]|uniref:UDP-glucose--hexose-1-phosphate uridylyltransferase n=1 Tax=Gordonibacter sp. 28C TaxID=2078569 RepID=UPI000DF7C9DF|nr:UDP-glucose--hexose-1-phosphate uridylyltransferase [Gordonibacter sp. 28C]RDB62259.1 galactose-1-phosphate uridylyltransferase [Gordonibacter sp. 28C]
MSATLPPPDEVRGTFDRLLSRDAETAVAYLHDLGTASGYLKTEAVARNICWTGESAYGELECTVNLSKPEKDPRAIAAAASSPAAGAKARANADAHAGQPPACGPSRVPQCDLCWENEEFPGAPGHPAKPGLRIAAVELGGERWGLQFSPYAYFPEHCIALSEEHRPMKIDSSCFERLLDFVDLFPFYFVGSNADLPIVGGSILSHDHFQGGRHTFPLMRAPVERTVAIPGCPEVRGGVVRWPASVLRLASRDRAALARGAARVLDAWRDFSNEACGVRAFSRGADGALVRHNTLNPIVHREGGCYVMDLVLRNNRTDAAHPWGIFHPGEELHHIKKENIGLIEIMGLAILPPRLARELPAVQQELARAAREGRTPQKVETRLTACEATAPHALWAADVYARRAAEFADETATPSLCPIVKQEVAEVFAAVLESTGVFKRDATGAAGWSAFIDELGTT